MLSSKSKFVSVLIAMMLVLSLTLPVFAQDEIEPIEDPELVEPEVEDPEVEETSFKFLDHPIVKLLAEFFSSFFNPPEEEEPVPDEVEGTGEDDDPGVLPPDEGDPNSDVVIDGGQEEEVNGEGTEPVEPQIVPEEKIASMKEENKMGFGVITKLMELARQTRSTCSETGEFCDVTLDSLIEEYEGGMSIGALFAKYGKPKNVGVGQIRKELDKKEKTNNGKGKNK